MINADIESSDSEREDYEGRSYKRARYDFYTTPRKVGRRNRQTSGARNSWTSGQLKWDVSPAGGVEDCASGTQENAVENSAASGRPIKRVGGSPESDIPLSDPRSWVWQNKTNATLAVAIDPTRGTFPVVSRPQRYFGRLVGQGYGRDKRQDDSKSSAGKPKTKDGNWKDTVDVPLLSSNLAKFAKMKQTPIDKFLAKKTIAANRITKTSAHRAKAYSRAPSGRASSADVEFASPNATDNDEISSNKSGYGISKSSTSTPATSAVNTPEPPASTTGRAVLSRNAKKRLPANLTRNALSSSDLDASSFSDFAISGDQSEAETEIESTGDPTAEETDVDTDGGQFIAPNTKRIKSSSKRQGNSHTVKSFITEDDVDEEDTGHDLLGDAINKSVPRKLAEDVEYKDNFKYKIGINEALKPISDIKDIFGDITQRACDLGLINVTTHLKGRRLKIATMCSGTESPLLAIRLVSDCLNEQGIAFDFEHLFSAEIVPYKQAYIERNFAPRIIFRDIKELSIPGAIQATTAYGGRASIPGGVDLLVAGFSCVDFSNLNNEKKTLRAGGESGDTFGAIKDYAEKHRPKMMILENVDGAPWKDIRDKAMPAIGYAAQFVKVDTKHYYIPQTRKRGYMICVDVREYHDPDGTRHIEKDRKIINTVLTKWEATLKSFERPASCSVEAFLLDEDDPRAIRGRKELANTGRGETRRTKEVDWARCHARHQDYRAGLFLGQKRPLTKWEDGGSCKPSDNMWQGWSLFQVERVLDTIDISWLRNLNRGFDHQHKLRLLELSQNVDRVTDTTGSGLAGCITPTGIPFSTIRGGPLIGLEALSLQGLPINKLQLTREKQSQLQDLAGNAMSSTVVGPAILAALIAGYKTLLPGFDSSMDTPGSDDSMDTDVPSSISEVCGEQNLVPFDLNLAAYKPISVSAIIDAASKTVRCCLCEGRTMVTTTKLQQCSLCRHTTCTKCGGNPLHRYQPFKQEIASQRSSPANFEDLIKAAMPMKFTFPNAGAVLQNLKLEYSNNIDSKSWRTVINAMSNAINSVLRFRSSKRSELWTIYYESEHALMELVISLSLVEWRLYAKPSTNDPVNSDIRKLLSKPIARMRPQGDDIIKGPWQFWLPKVYKFEATIQENGGLTRSFENVHGISRFADTEVWEEYSITIPSEATERLDVDISGTYKLLPDCGTALGLLHIQRESAKSSAPLFLFLDPDRIGHPNDDNFVFSTDKRRLNYGESRPVVARVDAAWRPQKLERVVEVSEDAEARYRIDGTKTLKTLSEARSPQKLTCYLDGRWVTVPSLSFKPPRDNTAAFRRAPPTLAINYLGNSCQVATLFLSCTASLPENERPAWKPKDWVEIPLLEHKEFFTSFAWLVLKASNLPSLNEWKEVSDSCTSCQLCAPDAPSIKWRLDAPKYTKTGNKVGLSKLVAFEDPVEAATFEHRLKSRPSPIVTQICTDDSGLINLRLAVNPQTLMHRAFARLSSSNDCRGVSMSWRLCTNQSLQSDISLPAFTLKNNNSDPPAAKPSGFLYDLRPEQLRSLAWMLGQESQETEPFVVEEVEEASIPQIGWRAEGRASQSILVRGGVLADQVGYGKTVTTIALIDVQRSHDREAAKLPVKGKIPIKATLIVVPPQLPDQWHGEIKKFLNKGRNYQVLVIKNIAALRKATIAQFQSADIIIISWKVCEGESYIFDLAQFAGIVELPKKKTRRAAAVWYEHALSEISEHVDLLKDGGKTLKSTLEQKLEASKTKAACEETFIPSKRLRGQAYQNAKQNQAKGNKRTHAVAFSEDSAAREDDQGRIGAVLKKEELTRRTDVFGIQKISTGKKFWTSMTCPLLELFEFSRLVVDEYTYVTGQESLTIPKLKAKSRWILSATPPLRDFADVKCISKFLGINLGIDDLTPGVTKAANIKALEKERTEYEQFQSFKLSQSTAWHENRHSVAQRFLDQFVRQNIADIEAIKGSTHIMPITLPAAERAIYLELNQLLAGNDFELRRGRSNADNDRARRIREVLGNSESAGEALIKCASHFTLGNLSWNFESAPEACDVIVKLRQSQYEGLKKDFEKKLKQAEWLEKACLTSVRQYNLWKGHINSNLFGDVEVMQEIKCMINSAENAYEKNHWVEFYITPHQKAAIENAAKSGKGARGKVGKKRLPLKIDSDDDLTVDEDSELEVDDVDSKENGIHNSKADNRRLKPTGFDDNRKMERAALELRDVTNDLRKLSTELVNRQRCLRFFEYVRKLQRLYTNLRDGLPLADECFCSKCRGKNLSSEVVSILSQCGHAICNNCLNLRSEGQDECLVVGCNAVNKSYQVIRAPELGVEDNKLRTGRHYGVKLEEIIQLIQKIPKDDQVLLFVQFGDLVEKIKIALKHNDVRYLALGESGDSSKELSEFQTNDKDTKKKVLVLNIGDASAAGSNLTMANHVIFVSPFLTESQQAYEQAMTQSVGRARRYGQLKPVHIYNFISLKTIDVDTLQLRSRKILAGKVAPAPEFIPFDSFTPSSFGLIDAPDGEKGDYGSAEMSKHLMEDDDA